MKNLIAYLSFFLVVVEAVAQVNVTGTNPHNSLLSVDQNIEDFNFALKELETSYAGFDTYVNDSTRQEYDSIVSTLRQQIGTNERSGSDAALFLYSWFDDGHLGMDMGSFRETGKYMSDRRKFQTYDIIHPYLPEPLSKPATSKTYLMRLPEFDNETVTPEFVENAIRDYNSSGCENLIIDLRSNGGGDERLWHPLLPMLYDHPGTTKSVEFRMSKNNIEYLKQAATEFPEAQMILDKYKKTHKEFILLTDKEDIEIEVPKYDGKKPRRIAFIIDANNGSATEELLIQAKAISDRTIIYGKENTVVVLIAHQSGNRHCPIVDIRFPYQLPDRADCPITALIKPV